MFDMKERLDVKNEDVNQFSRLNAKKIEEARCFLSTLFGNYCGAGNNEGKGCGLTAKELLAIWEANKIKQGFKICECNWVALGLMHKKKDITKCPDCKGIRRSMPTLEINEKIGYGLHQIQKEFIEPIGEVDTIIPYGNINYFCHGCNRIFERKHGDTIDNSSTTQFKKSHTVRHKFKNELKDALATRTELCYKATINKWSGRSDYNCSQDLLENAFDQELDRSLELFDIGEYGMQCKYPKCNGQHIKLFGIPMQKVKSDYEAFMQEQMENKDE
jgi:hypothetical protein